MRHLKAALWMALAALAFAGPAAAGKDALVIGLNLLGDGLRDVLDPRTRVA